MIETDTDKGRFWTVGDESYLVLISTDTSALVALGSSWYRVRYNKSVTEDDLAGKELLADEVTNIVVGPIVPDLDNFSSSAVCSGIIGGEEPMTVIYIARFDSFVEPVVVVLPIAQYGEVLTMSMAQSQNLLILSESTVNVVTAYTVDVGVNYIKSERTGLASPVELFSHMSPNGDDLAIQLYSTPDHVVVFERSGYRYEEVATYDLTTRRCVKATVHQNRNSHTSIILPYRMMS